MIVFSQEKDSLVKLYTYNGILFETGYLKKGKRDGEWKFYNDSLGYLNKVEYYKNDYPHGEVKEYNSSGVLISKGFYSNKAIIKSKTKEEQFGGYVYSYKTLPVGEWFYYDDKGKLIKKELYNKKGHKLKKEIYE
ncbi:MAG TPA: hypothetical protein VN698_07050 [Bacteroidia bacterium]|nr:hypothetical protein [Bacteroidia bacterium]